MKCIRLIVVLLLLLQLNTNAQTSPSKFGEIHKNDFDVNLSPRDQSAEAVVLYDIGKSHFVETEGSYEIIFNRKTRIKILSDAGLKWSEVDIPFYQEGDIFEEIYDVEACVYNVENGRLHKSKITKYNCHDEVVSKYWKSRKIALPNVKIGSIIEYRYKIRSQYIFNLRDWKFQWRIPVKYSEYDVHLIPFYEYSWILQGASAFASHERYKGKGLPRDLGYGIHSNDMVETYVMKDVPAFTDEEFITSINDYIIKIDFQLSKIHKMNGTVVKVSTTWPSFIKSLLKSKSFGKYVKRSKKLASKLLDIDEIMKKSQHDRFDYVIDYVKDNYSWNGYMGKYSSTSPKKFIKTKEGNCTDINLFTIGLLRAVGISSFPLLISTRGHGKIKYDSPFRHYFNYSVIYAEVDGKPILVDATNRHVSNYRLPVYCINGKGLLIKEGQSNFISLSCRTSSKIDREFDIQFLKTGMTVGVKNSSSEYDALRFRNSYGDDKDIIKERLLKKGYSVIDSTISVENNKRYNKPYVLKYSIKDKPELHANKLYVLPFLSESIESNPLKQKTRKYPIDLVYPTTRVFSSNIVIPEGYKVDFLPSDLFINNKLFSLNYKVTSDAKKVKILFSYSFKSSKYLPEIYFKINYYFKQIVKKGNEKLVFVKK